VHIAQILSAFETTDAGRPTAAGPSGGPSAISHRSSPLVEPLTPRELEVLALLGRHLTNKEIAAGLVISPATVKSHTVSIYSKLDVHKRQQAVARARELGLLPPRTV
jgi:LuxR family maltose regulon positive regulatory protein